MLEPGARVGRKLEVLRRLGEGGMGTLWVARNLTTGAEVAIKVLRTQGGRNVDVDAKLRFRHEARVGAMLAHRNITRVFDLLEDEDGTLVLIMELHQGESLETALEKGTLSGKEAVAVMAPVLSALQHAHEHGIVHRDIKPSNIFLHIDPDGHCTPKLLDFGIAKVKDSSVKTLAGNILGSPGYMSPEHVRGVHELDGRSDLFSVGTVLYEMITGENPFGADLPSGTLARVLEVEVDPDPRIEPRLWREIQRALSKQPYERHRSAGALALALREAVGEPPSEWRRDDPPNPRAGELPRSEPQPTLSEARAAIHVHDGVAARVGRLPRSVRGGVYGLGLLLAVGLVLLSLAAWRPPKPQAPQSASGASGAPSVPPAPAIAAAASASGSPAEGPTELRDPAEAPPGATKAGAPKRTPTRRTAAPQPTAAASPKPPTFARTPGF